MTFGTQFGRKNGGKRPFSGQFIHLGKGTVVSAGSILGIFDLDNTSQSRITRDYLARAEKAGRVVSAAEDLPKSFVVCSDGDEPTVYLSQMAAATLLKRAEESNQTEAKHG